MRAAAWLQPLNRGLRRRGAAANNGSMKIQSTQIHDGDAEPVDERPSEFTGYSDLSAASGFHTASTNTRRPSAPPRCGLASLPAAALGVLALGALVIAKLLPSFPLLR